MSEPAAAAALAPGASPDYDAATFYAGLVAHGLIVPVGAKGVFGRNAVFEDVLARVDARITAAGADDGAVNCMYPPVIDRQVLEKVNYLESFPHLCGAVHSFFGNAIEALALAERAREGGPWGQLLQQTGVTLNPAVCYPMYPGLAGTLPAAGRLLTTLGWAYRHEPSDEPTRMQAYRVREYVCAGTPEQVVQWRDTWLQRGLTLLQGLQLPARADVAADPFFGRGGRMMAASQREQKLKFEVLVPVISLAAPTAICSFNYHQDKFGSVFGIQSHDGAVAHTACLGFGMERLTMALFKAHGFVPAQWPQAVRAQLWA